MTAQETGQRLRKCRTRHHRITSGFLGLELEIALNVGNESHDRGALLELGFQLGNYGERLDAIAVQINNDQRRLVCRVLRQFGRNLFLAFYEFHPDIQLAADLLDFRQEEEVIDKSIYFWWAFLLRLKRFQFSPGGIGAKPIAEAASLATGPIALVAIAMVHGANKDRIPALPAVAIIAVIAVLGPALPALALLAALVLLTALILITVTTPATPRFPVRRVLLRLIKCIVHLVTCVVCGRLRRSS